MKVSLKNIIIPTIPMAVILLSGCVALWLLNFFVQSLLENSGITNSVEIFNFLSISGLFDFVLSVIITLMNAFLLEQLNKKFNIIRTRTFLPILIFVLLISSWSSVKIGFYNHLALTFIIISLFHYFNMYHDRQAVEYSFVGSLFIALSSIIVLPYVLIILVFWLGFLIFQCFSMRTFLASLFGMLVPWIIYCVICYYLNIDFVLTHNLLNIDFSFPIIELSVLNLIFISSLILLLLISLFGLFTNTRNDSISTRSKLNFMFVMLLATIILALVFQNYFPAILPLLALSFSVLTSHSFSLQNKNLYAITFLLLTVVSVAYVLINFLNLYR